MSPPVGSPPSRRDAARVGLSTARTALNVAAREDEFQATVIEMAELLGWRWHHETDSRRTRAGWPDLVLVRPPRVIVAELKSERGAVTPDQQAWLDAFAGCPDIEAHVWRPSDMGAIEQTLRAS